MMRPIKSLSVLATVVLLASLATAAPAAAQGVVIQAGSATIVDDFDGVRTVRVPVELSNVSTDVVSVDWTTEPGVGAGYAQPGLDYEAASGTLTFEPGQTVQHVAIRIIGDELTEIPVIDGEFGLVGLSAPVGGTIGVGGFYGYGLFVILDQRPTVVEQFDASGAAQTWMVPAGVQSITVEACGAQGGGPDGGLGGKVGASIAVTAGEQLSVYVGQQDGFNGGGFGTYWGGGASDVRQGGSTLADRVVVGGGGGGTGGFTITGSLPIPGEVGGAGGGLAGESGAGIAGGSPGTQTAAGGNGGFGYGGYAYSEYADIIGGGGGGGGWYGGSGGGQYFQGVPPPIFGPGGGGSGLGDTHEVGVCAGDGWVEIAYQEPPSVLPGSGVIAEGDSGTSVLELPVTLSSRSVDPVTVEWATLALGNASGIAQPGSDFVTAGGTVTFAPNQTNAVVSVDIVGDTDDEPPLLWGEWGGVAFGNSVGASIDTSWFFGLGLFIIIDDD